MIYYDCHHFGNTTAAIGVCHDCGAGMCADHAIEHHYVLTVVTATSTQTPIEPPQRRIRCQACAAAIDAARQTSIGPGRRLGFA